MHALIEKVDQDWQPLLLESLKTMDKDYLRQISKQPSNWLPAASALFAAFTQPSLETTKYILLGESPYPRAASAKGYAFWDAAVDSLWSETGLSKAVNRATSLRNILKMLLVAQGDLDKDLSQQAIAALDKSRYLQSLNQLFIRLLEKGFLLLNASLIYETERVSYHAKQWRPFLGCLLNELRQRKPSLHLLLFGRIAQDLPEAAHFPCLIAPHPYNLTFIRNQEVLAFFKPLHLLSL